MLPATLLLPHDNKPLKWALKSILAAFTTPSDNATMPQHSSRATQQASSSTAGHRLHQLTRAHQATRWQLRPPQATSTQKTQQNQARIGHIPRENQPLLMTLCPSIEKSIIPLSRYNVLLFRYCIYPVILNRYMRSVDFGCFPIRMRPPPPPKKMDPFFTRGPNLENGNCQK